MGAVGLVLTFHAVPPEAEVVQATKVYPVLRGAVVGTAQVPGDAVS